MTNEVMLKRLNEIFVYADVGTMVHSCLAEIMEDLKNDICTKNMKSSGKSAVYAAAKRIVKDAQAQGNPKFDGAMTIDGNQYICDGYRCVKFYKPMELPKVTNEKDHIDYIGLMENAKNNATEIELPDVGELKSAVKIHRAEYVGRPKYYRPGVWYLGKNEYYDIAVNSQYLLDMLEALPNCKCYFGDRNSMLYFVSENGEGILCRIRTGKDTKYMNYIKNEVEENS